MKDGIYLLTAIVIIGLVIVSVNLHSVQSEVKGEIFKNKNLLQLELDDLNSYLVRRITLLENIVISDFKQLVNQISEFRDDYRSAIVEENKKLAYCISDVVQGSEAVFIKEVAELSLLHLKNSSDLQNLLKDKQGEKKGINEFISSGRARCLPFVDDEIANFNREVGAVMQPFHSGR